MSLFDVLSGNARKYSYIYRERVWLEFMTCSTSALMDLTDGHQMHSRRLNRGLAEHRVCTVTLR